MTKSWFATIIWMAMAAITSVEAYAQYLKHHFSSVGFWLFGLIFIFCVLMFFRSRIQRSKDKRIK